MAKTKMKKFTVIQTSTVRKCYEVEAESADLAVDMVNSGDVEPTQEDEDLTYQEVLDEKGKEVDWEE